MGKASVCWVWPMPPAGWYPTVIYLLLQFLQCKLGLKIENQVAFAFGRVGKISVPSDRDTPVFCALINGDGEVVDFLRLPYFMKRRNAFREDEREKKVLKEKSVLILDVQIRSLSVFLKYSPFFPVVSNAYRLMTLKI